MKGQAQTVVTESVGPTACQPRCADGYFLVDGVTSEIYDADTRITSSVPNTFLCDYETYHSEEFKWFVEPECRVVRTCTPTNDCFGGTCSLDQYTEDDYGERKYWCYLKGVDPFQSTVCEDIVKDTKKCKDCFNIRYPTGDKHDWFKSYDVCKIKIEGLLAALEARKTCSALEDCASPCEEIGDTGNYQCRVKNVEEDGDGFVRGEVKPNKCSDISTDGSVERHCNVFQPGYPRNAKLYYYSANGAGGPFAYDATQCQGTEAESEAAPNCLKVSAALGMSPTDGQDNQDIPRLEEYGSDFSIATCAKWCESLPGCVGYLFDNDAASDDQFAECFALGKIPEEICSHQTGHQFVDEPCMMLTDHPDFDSSKAKFKT